MLLGAFATYVNNSNNCNLVHGKVDSGQLGNNFHDSLINHRQLDYTCLATPRTSLTAEGALLESTGERVLQGVISDNHGNCHLVRIQILVVYAIGCKLSSVETAPRNGIIFTLDRENPRMKAFGVTLPLGGEHDDLCSFVCDLSADGYGCSSENSFKRPNFTRAA